MNITAEVWAPVRGYEGLYEASDAGGKLGEMIRRVCAGERSHYRGLHYAFYSDYINDTIPEFKGRGRRKPSVTLWR